MNKVTVTVDGGKAVGKIKPMHAINNIPRFSGTNIELLKEAKIPYCRLHDAALYTPYNLVDIHRVFPDFGADETKEESYDFTFTDRLLEMLAEQGVKPFFRLGVSIENYAYIKPYYIYPPADFHKWARICEHIVRHYNEGWANGCHYDIEYWEIWNEPDNASDEPDSIIDNAMWRGTKEQFFELYEIASNHLKKRFPHLKIGGYASSGFYYILKDTGAVSAAKVSPRYEYFVKFFDEFLAYISSPEHRSPLDFYSFHSYSGVHQNEAYVKYVRERLDKYGFTETETNLNEWNPSFRKRGTLEDSANVSANFVALQNSALDMAMYYQWVFNSNYCGAIDPISDKPFATYYAFWNYGRLYGLGTQVAASTDAEEVYALAACKDGVTDIIIVNASEEKYELKLCGVKNVREVRRTARAGTDCIDMLSTCPRTLAPWQTLYIHCVEEK